mmetsp:Transcript_96819/g.279512  ORF Transcript_96819/g.279512 Transcript_96819/m.279512 type:complete len:301 (+) Transcript_96819:417-1319(+)
MAMRISHVRHLHRYHQLDSHFQDLRRPYGALQRLFGADPRCGATGVLRQDDGRLGRLRALLMGPELRELVRRSCRRLFRVPHFGHDDDTSVDACAPLCLVGQLHPAVRGDPRLSDPDHGGLEQGHVLRVRAGGVLHLRHAGLHAAIAAAADGVVAGARVDGPGSDRLAGRHPGLVRRAGALLARAFLLGNDSVPVALGGRMHACRRLLRSGRVLARLRRVLDEPGGEWDGDPAEVGATGLGSVSHDSARLRRRGGAQRQRIVAGCGCRARGSARPHASLGVRHQGAANRSAAVCSSSCYG